MKYYCSDFSGLGKLFLIISEHEENFISFDRKRILHRAIFLYVKFQNICVAQLRFRSERQRMSLIATGFNGIYPIFRRILRTCTIYQFKVSLLIILICL